MAGKMGNIMVRILLLLPFWLLQFLLSLTSRNPSNLKSPPQRVNIMVDIVRDFRHQHISMQL
ncbi:hypothetical protein ACB094_03G058300 [Castanea mollissima]